MAHLHRLNRIIINFLVVLQYKMDWVTSFIAMWSLYIMESTIIEENKKRYRRSELYLTYNIPGFHKRAILVRYDLKTDLLPIHTGLHVVWALLWTPNDLKYLFCGHQLHKLKTGQISYFNGHTCMVHVQRHLVSV